MKNEYLEKTNSELLDEMDSLRNQMTSVKKSEKRYKIKLHESEEKYRVLVESAEDAIFTFDDGTAGVPGKKDGIVQPPQQYVGIQEEIHDRSPLKAASSSSGSLPPACTRIRASTSTTPQRRHTRLFADHEEQ